MGALRCLITLLGLSFADACDGEQCVSLLQTRSAGAVEGAIPCRIHQIGWSKETEKWMKSWQEKNPKCEYKLWTLGTFLLVLVWFCELGGGGGRDSVSWIRR